LGHLWGVHVRILTKLTKTQHISIQQYSVITNYYGIQKIYGALNANVTKDDNIEYMQQKSIQAYLDIVKVTIAL